MGGTDKIKRMTICRKIFNNYPWYSLNLAIQTFCKSFAKDSAEEYKLDLCFKEEILDIQNCSLKVLNNSSSV